MFPFYQSPPTVVCSALSLVRDALKHRLDLSLILQSMLPPWCSLPGLAAGLHLAHVMLPNVCDGATLEILGLHAGVLCAGVSVHERDIRNSTTSATGKQRHDRRTKNKLQHNVVAASAAATANFVALTTNTPTRHGDTHSGHRVRCSASPSSSKTARTIPAPAMHPSARSRRISRAPGRSHSARCWKRSVTAATQAPPALRTCRRFKAALAHC